MHSPPGARILTLAALVALIGVLVALADSTGAASRGVGDPSAIVVQMGSGLERFLGHLGRGARGVAYAGMALGLLAVASGKTIPTLRWIGLGLGLFGTLATLTFAAVLLLSVAGHAEAEFAHQELQELAPFMARSIQAQGLAEAAVGIAVGSTLAACVLPRSGTTWVVFLALPAWLLSMGAEVLARIAEASAMNAAWGTYFAATPGEITHMATSAITVAIAGTTFAGLLRCRSARDAAR